MTRFLWLCRRCYRERHEGLYGICKLGKAYNTVSTEKLLKVLKEGEGKGKVLRTVQVLYESGFLDGAELSEWTKRVTGLQQHVWHRAN